jgi:hypothetical protein
MRTSKVRLASTLATAVALGLCVSACGSSSKSSSAATTTTSPAPTPLTITAGDYAYSGVPATMPAGIIDVKFVNRGTVDHEMSFVKVADNSNPKAIFTGLDSVLQGGPFPATFLAANGIPNTPPGKTINAKFNLTPGQYLAFCTDTGVVGSKKDGKPHFTRGMYKKITVTGTGGTVTPTASSSLVAHDYGFDVSGLQAGDQTIAFKNEGPVQWHFAEILGFPKGVTVATAQAEVPKLLASNGEPPAGVVPPDEIAGSQVASPGYGNTFSATLEKGRTYVVLCFVSDKLGGPPHAIAHHMYKVFTIS